MAVVAIVASGIFVLNAYVTYLYSSPNNTFDWFFVVGSNFWNYMMWAILVPVALGPIFSRKWPWQISIKAIVFWLVFAFVLSAVHRFTALAAYVFSFYLYEDIYLDLFGLHSFNSIMRGTIPSFIQFVVIVAALRALQVNAENTRRLLDLERVRKELATAELNMLKGQMQPHFIFNTLNTIASVMEKNTAAAQDIITRLASLMRSFLESDRKQFVSLETEIEHTRDYLEIEAARFSDRLNVSWDVDGISKRAAVPNMLLQPLVENAIKHGFSRQVSGGAIAIEASVQGGDLMISVSDDGAGSDKLDILDGSSDQGVGLRSVRARLTALYGDEASIAVETSPGKGFCVRIKLPLKNESEAEE